MPPLSLSNYTDAGCRRLGASRPAGAERKRDGARPDQLRRNHHHDRQLCDGPRHTAGVSALGQGVFLGCRASLAGLFNRVRLLRKSHMLQTRRNQ